MPRGRKRQCPRPKPRGPCEPVVAGQVTTLTSQEAASPLSGLRCVGTSLDRRGRRAGPARIARAEQASTLASSSRSPIVRFESLGPSAAALASLQKGESATTLVVPKAGMPSAAVPQAQGGSLRSPTGAGIGAPHRDGPRCTPPTVLAQRLQVLDEEAAGLLGHGHHGLAKRDAVTAIALMTRAGTGSGVRRKSRRTIAYSSSACSAAPW
jgi:hypothetical protein